MASLNDNSQNVQRYKEMEATSRDEDNSQNMEQCEETEDTDSDDGDKETAQEEDSRSSKSNVDETDLPKSLKNIFKSSKKNKESKKHHDTRVQKTNTVKLPTDKQRGFMVIIVNDVFKTDNPRPGAEKDLKMMGEIATEFGFDEIVRIRNRSKAEIMKLIEDVSNLDFTNCKCFLFVISTHGGEVNNKENGGKDHMMECSDGEWIHTATIVQLFSDKNCPTLRDKPKLFFVQACRGNKTDSGVEVQVVTSQPNHTSTNTPTGSGDKGDGHDAKTDTGLGVFNYKSGLRGDALCDQSNIDQTQMADAPDAQRIYVDVPGNDQHGNWSGEKGAPAIMQTGDDVDTKPDADSWQAGIGSLTVGSDMMVMFAIPSGQFAWRNNSEGSWMLHYFHKILMDSREPIFLLKLITKINGEMSKRETDVPKTKLDKKKAVCVILHKLKRNVLFDKQQHLTKTVF